MAKNFASVAFTDAVKALQEKNGSRMAYARMESDMYVNGLTENEIDFISQRDSFYMASTGDSGFPYIQHRGGPKGFVKVLDVNRIGFIDFRGNRQYISVGNITSNNKVALIMVDYPSRTRLKILAKAAVMELKDNAALFALLNVNEYTFKPERMIVLDVEAYDWNCPQHITPRYTIEDIEAAFTVQRQHIATLQEEINKLKQQLKTHE